MWKKRRILLIAIALLLSLTAQAMAASYSTLRPNDQGNEVQQMQTALNQLGYATGGIDGKYGSATEAAVRLFQSQHSLTVDGKAGQQTLAMLYQLTSQSSTAQATPSVTETLASGLSKEALFGGDYSTIKYGDRGNRVSTLQDALNTLGFTVGQVDGRFGKSTEQAVVSFQQVNGLTADGKAGQLTLKHLEKVMSGQSVPVYTPPASSDNNNSNTNNSNNNQGNANTGYTVPTRTLRSGDSGEDVRTVQRRLQELSYYTGTLDGKYGSGTVAAVKLFQQRNGLTADGKAGTKTYAVLFSQSAIANAATSTTPTTPTFSGPYTNLTIGSTGEAVTSLQTALLNLKYTVSVTGTYDATTRAAVVAFQQRNGLTADGIAGKKTQEKLYSGNCVTGDTALPSVPDGAGTDVTPPSVSQLKLLHWFDDIKPTLKSRCIFTIYDPATGLSWKLRLYSAGRHADSEPLTLTDTQVMFKAFGNQNTWTQKPVYVLLPSGTWTIAAMHNVPHLSGSIKDNGFDGHLCVHFLRTMSEAEKNDPKYGVSNQKTIRQFWKSLTGQEITY